jgi:thiol-disulfide isomerase/thioredoxin
MKRIFDNLALFVVMTLAFSALTGCGGGSGNVEVGTTNSNANANTNTLATGSRSSEYPPLASGLAQADLELLDGTKFKISDHKGKVLLLNLWGTWCGPCRAEMPSLVKLKEQYGSQGFEILGLNVGDGQGSPESNELIEPFVEKMGLNYLIARIPNPAMREFYKITKQDVVPQTLLVDREGHLRGVFIGGGGKVIESMKQTVEKTLAEG